MPFNDVINASSFEGLQQETTALFTELQRTAPVGPDPTLAQELGGRLDVPQFRADPSFFDFVFDAEQFRAAASTNQLFSADTEERITDEDTFKEIVGDLPIKFKNGITKRALANEIAAYKMDTLLEFYKSNGFSDPVSEFMGRFVGNVLTAEGAVAAGAGLLAAGLAAPLFAAAPLAGSLAEGVALFTGAVAVETVIGSAPSILYGKSAREATGQREYTWYDAAADVGLNFIATLGFGGLNVRGTTKALRADLKNNLESVGLTLEQMEKEYLAQVTKIKEFWEQTADNIRIANYDARVQRLYSQAVMEGYDVTVEDIQRMVELTDITDLTELFRKGIPKSQRGSVELGQRAAEDFAGSTQAQKVFREQADLSHIETPGVSKGDVPNDLSRVLVSIGSGNDEAIDPLIDELVRVGVVPAKTASVRKRVIDAADVVRESYVLHTTSKVLSGSSFDSIRNTVNLITSELPAVLKGKGKGDTLFDRVVDLFFNGAEAERKAARQYLKDSGVRFLREGTVGETVAPPLSKLAKEAVDSARKKLTPFLNAKKLITSLKGNTQAARIVRKALKADGVDSSQNEVTRLLVLASVTKDKVVRNAAVKLLRNSLRKGSNSEKVLSDLFSSVEDILVRINDADLIDVLRNKLSFKDFDFANLDGPLQGTPKAVQRTKSNISGSSSGSSRTHPADSKVGNDMISKSPNPEATKAVIDEVDDFGNKMIEAISSDVCGIG